MAQVAKILPAPAPFESMDVLCDVTNPLFGPRGAAWIYGRQKGGSDAVLAQLDDGLRHIAQVVQAQLGRDCRGHAGRRGGGRSWLWRHVFMNARLRRGIEIVLDMTGFDTAARDADLIITGEGHLDGQSAQGKLIQGLCGRSQGTAGDRAVRKIVGLAGAGPGDRLKAAYSINAQERPAGRNAGGDGGQPGKDRDRTGALIGQRAVEIEAVVQRHFIHPPCPAPWDDGRRGPCPALRGRAAQPRAMQRSSRSATMLPRPVGALARPDIGEGPAIRPGPTALKSPMMAAGPSSCSMMWRNWKRLRNWPWLRCTLAMVMPWKAMICARRGGTRPEQHRGGQPDRGGRRKGMRAPRRQAIDARLHGWRKKCPPTSEGSAMISSVASCSSSRSGCWPAHQPGDILHASHRPGAAGSSSPPAGWAQ